MNQAIKHISLKTPQQVNLTSTLDNTTQAANFTYDMANRLDVIFDDYDGTSKTYYIKSPADCLRNTQSVKNMLGEVVIIYRNTYTITKLITDVDSSKAIHQKEIIGFKAKRVMIAG